jgi:Tol biopolymer transport system component
MKNFGFIHWLCNRFCTIGFLLIIFSPTFAKVDMQTPTESTNDIAFINLSDVYLMNSDGTNQHQLTEIRPGPSDHPSWSPDGNKIVFNAITANPLGSSSSNEDIYIVDVYSRQTTNLTHNKADDVFPVWSPKGDKIAFVSNLAGNWQIYLMNVDGTEQTRLTHSDADDGIHGLTWSPDGSKIAFVSNRYQNTKTISGNYEYENIYLIDVPQDTNRFKELAAYNLTSAIHQCPAGEFYLNPSWSVNNQLSFATLNCSINWDIAIFDIDDALENQTNGLPYFNLTRRPNEDGALGLSWSPDGSKIIFVSNHPEVTRATSEDIYLVDVNETLKTDSPHIKQLTNEPEFNNVYSLPTWKPNHK